MAAVHQRATVQQSSDRPGSAPAACPAIVCLACRVRSVAGRRALPGGCACPAPMPIQDLDSFGWGPRSAGGRQLDRPGERRPVSPARLRPLGSDPSPGCDCLDAQRSGVRQVRQGCGRPDLVPTTLPGRLAARCGMAPSDPAGRGSPCAVRRCRATQGGGPACRPGRLAGLGCVMYQTFAPRRAVRREPPRRRRVALPQPIVMLLFDRNTSSLQPPLAGTASTASATDPR